MVTRRGYVSSTGGFADGFTSGFGMMNQAYNDKRKLDQADEAMKYERERDLARDAESLRQFEASEAAAERRFGLQQDAAQRQFDLDKARLEALEEQNKIASGLAATKAETERLKQERETAAAQALQDEQDKAEYMTRATNAYARLNNALQAPAGTYRDDYIMQAIDDTAGGILDIRNLLGTDFQADIAAMTKEIRRGLQAGNLDLNNRAVLDGLTSLFDNRRGKLIGRTVDETFTNAPDEYKNGDWEVRDRFVTEVKQDPSNPAILSATVGVEIVSKRTGESAYYDAPLTENRGAGSAPAGISIRDAIDSIAGTSMLLQEIEKFRPDIERGLIMQKFGNDNLKFENAVEAEMQRLLEKKATDGDDASTIIPTKVNSAVGIDDIRNLARSKVLGTGRGDRVDSRGDRLRVISETKDQLDSILARALFKDADDQEKRIVFSGSEILRMNAFDDRRALEEYIARLAKNKGGYFKGPQRKTAGRGIAATANNRGQ